MEIEHVVIIVHEKEDSIIAMPIIKVRDDCLEGCNKEKTCSQVRKRYASNTYGQKNRNDDGDFR